MQRELQIYFMSFAAQMPWQDIPNYYKYRASKIFIFWLFRAFFLPKQGKYTRQKKFCTLGSFGEFYLNLHLTLYIVV